MTAFETWAEPRPIKLTADDFLQLAEAGALQAYKKTELIDGVIVAVSPALSTHSLVQGEFHVRLALAAREAAPHLRAALEDPSQFQCTTCPRRICS